MRNSPNSFLQASKTLAYAQNVQQREHKMVVDNLLYVCSFSGYNVGQGPRSLFGFFVDDIWVFCCGGLARNGTPSATKTESVWAPVKMLPTTLKDGIMSEN